MVLLTIFSNFYLSTISRLLLGIGVGLCSCLGPLYVNENVEPEYRGRIGSLYQLLCTFGIFVAYGMNYAFQKVYDDDHLSLNKWQWQGQFGIGISTGVLLAILLIFTPVSKSGIEIITVNIFQKPITKNVLNKVFVRPTLSNIGEA
uniref:MFS transporter n=1 Tax=Opalina sp. OP10 TaxID=2666322 RepID=A0A649UYV3_9STRA|nr:MFS transporter [Opalina sp. OP10]